MQKGRAVGAKGRAVGAKGRAVGAKGRAVGAKGRAAGANGVSAEISAEGLEELHGASTRRNSRQYPIPAESQLALITAATPMQYAKESKCRLPAVTNTILCCE